DRDDLDAVQRELREREGCSVIIYDQTCAAEKRRRRKRGTLADPDQRVMIHSDVCEGCGDCGIQSNCLSILPKETDAGRKRTIDQSGCNKDFSCVRGFCPSFVTVKGGKLKKPAGVSADVDFPALPEPTPVSGNDPYGILLTGVGGTGVVTVSALLGMAAHIEGKGVSVLDQTGLAQKFGAVVSHIRISHRQDNIHAVRIPAGEADLMLAFDLMVAATDDALAKLDTRFSRAVVNAEPAMPAAFTRDPDIQFPGEAMEQSVREACRADGSWFLDAGGLARALMADGMAVNLFTVGFAYQQGLLPLSAHSIERAIELNNVSVEKNKQAFLWGRRAAHDLEKVRALAFPASKTSGAQTVQVMETTDQLIERNKAHLTDYQSAALARRYEKLVRAAEKAISARLGRDPMLLRAIAENYAKVLAYKDEYEVARLFSNGSLRKQLTEEFEGEVELEFNLAPPLLSRGKNGERPKKIKFGPWMETVFALLAKARGLRGTPLDPFGYTADRRLERRIIREYEADVAFLLRHLSADHAVAARNLASLPAKIRGYGPVKEHAYQAARKERNQWRAELNPQAREHQQIANAAV
ncbi:MAG: 2-oxoacid:acceptor oxidoreductase family protein, partial [Marinobacter sp.]|nr:2-oxoacid:acceptor oxidoreductase family protein [Marinobacter sp.]